MELFRQSIKYIFGVILVIKLKSNMPLQYYNSALQDSTPRLQSIFYTVPF